MGEYADLALEDEEGPRHDRGLRFYICSLPFVVIRIWRQA